MRGSKGRRVASLKENRCLRSPANDGEALLDRALLILVPRTVSDRYAPQFREQAECLHAEFWEQRDGPPEPLE